MLFASQNGLILIFLKISEKWGGYSPPSPPGSAALVASYIRIPNVLWFVCVTTYMIATYIQCL